MLLMIRIQLVAFYTTSRTYSLSVYLDEKLDELKVRASGRGGACVTVTAEMCKRDCDSVFERRQTCIDRGGQQLLP